jgi:hypothetical protein
MKHVINNNAFGMVDAPNPLPTWTIATNGSLSTSLDLSDPSTNIRGFSSMFRLYVDKDESLRLQVKQDGQWIFVPTVKWYEEEMDKL